MYCAVYYYADYNHLTSNSGSTTIPFFGQVTWILQTVEGIGKCWCVCTSEVYGNHTTHSHSKCSRIRQYGQTYQSKVIWQTHGFNHGFTYHSVAGIWLGYSLVVMCGWLVQLLLWVAAMLHNVSGMWNGMEPGVGEIRRSLCTEQMGSLGTVTC